MTRRAMPEQLHIRLPADLLQRLEAHVQRVRVRTGYPIGRSDIARALLDRALSFEEAQLCDNGDNGDASID